MPVLTSTVPTLIMFKGGDALSVCLNTVAVLFLCDVDNITYAILMDERVRTRVELRDRMHPSDAEAQALAKSKAMHVGLLLVALPGSLFIYPHSEAMSFFIPWAVFYLGRVLEVVCGPAGDATNRCKQFGMATAAWIVGACCMGILGSLVFV